MTKSSLLPTALLNCFGVDLPTLARRKTRYESRDSTTASTLLTQAPMVLYLRPSSSFGATARQVLESEVVQNSRLFDLRLASAFPACRLETEGDVVLNSTLHIISSCMEVLEHMYPGKWHIYSERSEALEMNLHDFSDTSALPAKVDPPAADNTVRYGLILRTTPQNGEESVTIAVIEYKGIGLIRYQDFRKAVVDENDSDEKLKKKWHSAAKKGKGTYLRQNGATFTKQARRYAQQSKCPDIAVFNWDNILLYEFALGMNEDTKDCRTMLTWVTEGQDADLEQKKQPGDCVEVGYIREALLGRLLQVFAKKLAPETEVNGDAASQIVDVTNGVGRLSVNGSHPSHSPSIGLKG